MNQPADRQGPVCAPLSYPQERLWFLAQLDAGSVEYQMPQVWRMHGRLDRVAFQRALEAIAQRHESLRTRIGEVDGAPVQIVEPEVPTDVTVHDLSHLEADVRRAQIETTLRRAWASPLDLRRAPLWRVDLLKLGAEEHIFARTTHHIVTDGWSDAIFTREFGALYEAFAQGRDSTLPPPRAQYADFARSQREVYEAGALDPGIRYWAGRLKNLPSPLPLPVRRPRRDRPGIAAVHRASLGADLLDALRRLASREQVSLFMVLLAVFQVLVVRWTGSRDVPVGVMTANRPQAALEGVIGFFVNTVVVRGYLAGDLTFLEVLRRTAADCLGAYAHQDVPFEKVVEILGPARRLTWNPLIQVVFNLLNFRRAAPRLHGLEVEVVSVERRAPSTFDLKVDVVADDDGCLTVSYNSELFDRDDIRNVFDEFERLLWRAATNPELPVEMQALAMPIAGSAEAAFTDTPATDDDLQLASPADEAVLRELFAEVLGLEHVESDDDFFELGGHSLLVMWLQNGVRARLGVELSVRAVFEWPTPRQLSERMRCLG
jgi:hypothetical protein